MKVKSKTKRQMALDGLTFQTTFTLRAPSTKDPPPMESSSSNRTAFTLGVFRISRLGEKEHMKICKMVTNLKESGKKIFPTVMEWKYTTQTSSMKGALCLAVSSGREFTNGLMEKSMKGSSTIILVMEWENYSCLMEIAMRESGGLDVCMGQVHITGRMDKNMRDSTGMEKNMVRVNITMKTTQYTRENGVRGYRKGRGLCVRDLMR